MWVLVTAGTGAGQIRTIYNYVGSTKTADIDHAWITTPDATSEYLIYSHGAAHVHELETQVLSALADAVFDEAKSGHTAAGSFGAEIQSHATPSEVNAEVLDVMATDTITEPSAGAPPATPSIKTAISYWWMRFRNKQTATNSLAKIHNDAGTAIAKQAVSDDGSTLTKSEMTAP
jgi:hypothetical protein